jgi:probable F420-dependent oxidoreductase
MKIGLYIFTTEYSIRIDELAREAEDRGFESLWLPEHTHIPASRRSPWPGGGELPLEYPHTLDLFVALTAAAAVTKSIKLGSGLCLVIERDPIITAKEVASVDYLSNGRFQFGIGAGWNAEEMENHGTDFKTRFKRMCDYVQAMKAIWTETEAEYHGEFIDFDPIWSYPKPVQKPYPPIHLGGTGPHTLQRVVDFCDGWIPLGRDPDTVIATGAELRRVAERAGRDFETIELTVYGAAPKQPPINRYQEAGFHRVLLGLPSADRDEILPRLDKYSRLLI